MAKVEVSRTLVKSPPELWTELGGQRLADAVGEVTVTPTEPERALNWETQEAHGTAVLEPSGWGTKVTLTAEIEEAAARLGVWGRLRGGQPPFSPHAEIERKLDELLDDLGAAHRKPFTRE